MEPFLHLFNYKLPVFLSSLDGLLSELDFSIYRGARSTPCLLIEREPGAQEVHVGIQGPGPQLLVRILLLLDLLAPLSREVAQVISLSFENLYCAQKGVLSEPHTAVYTSNRSVGHCLVDIMRRINHIP
jgi:hypothetical protein